MESRRLGASGLRVSELGLGTMTWGHRTGPEEAAELLRTFIEAGGTLIDTADVYCGGTAERLVGELLGDVVPRSEVVLATKAALVAGGGCDASRRYLLGALEGSLRRLRTDHVDLWQVHGHDPGTPLEETLAAVDAAVAAGKVRYAGLAAVPAWRLARAATWQRCWPGRTPLVAVGAEYSLLHRQAEDALAPAAGELGTGLLAWSPLGRGVLTGKYRGGVPADSRAADPDLAPFVEALLTDRSRAIVESVATAAEGLGVSPLAVALRWVTDRPAVAAAIVGPRTTEQLTAVLDAEDLTLPATISDALDDVSALPATPDDAP